MRRYCCPRTYFYPRPPRGGRLDPLVIHRVYLNNFYPRPPRGGRHQLCRRCPQLRRISIHALREEGDRFGRTRASNALQFLSTPSARRATRKGRHCNFFQVISIHALREEGDSQNPFMLEKVADISIHALREEGDFPVFAYR